MSITAAELLAIVGVRGADEAALKLVRVGAAADSAGVQLATLATVGTVLAGAGLVALGVHAVQMAGDFQQSITKLYTTAGEAKSNLQMVGDGILAMSSQVGTGAQTLVNAMYYVESAGFHGKQGLDVLKIAAMGAKAENSDLTSVVKTLVSTLNAYAGTGLTASRAMNTLIAATSQGHMTLNDLSGAISNVLPATARFHISLIDTTGAIAEMTKQGDNASSAATHLRQMILALESPSKIGAKALKSVGLTTQEVSDAMKKSLPDTLQMITEAVGRKFPEGSAAYNKAIRDIAGGSRQMMGFLELTGAHLNDFKDIVAKMTEQVKSGGKAIMGWTDVQQNFNFKVDAAKAAVEALAIKAGTQLLPILGKLLDAVIPLISQFTDWIDKNNVLTNAFNTTVSIIQNSINFYNQWKGVIQNTAIALTVFFTPAIIKAGIEAVVSAAKITYNFVASLILTGAQGWAAAGKLAVFIAQMVVVGTQAVISAAKVTVSFIASLIATGVQAYVAAYAISGSFVPALGMVGMQALAAAGKLLVGLIPALGATDVALSATGVAATVALGPIGLLIAIVGVASLAFVAMKKKSDEMNLGVSGAFDTMGNKIQRSTGRIIATADQMKQDTSNAANDMKKNVTTSFDSMSFWVRHDTGEMSDTAKSIFGQLVKDVKGDWSQLDQATKDYWNSIADYIDNKSGLAAQAAQRNFDRIHMPNLTGGQFGTISHLAGNAEGTDNWRGGLTWVGEKGPEILNLPHGSQIIPNNKIGSMGGGSAPVIHNHIDVYLDGTRMTGQLMPRIVQGIRTATGARF